MNFLEGYWNHRYLQKETGWDIGFASTPLKEYFDQLTDPNLKILIPGGGNSYEAEYLFQNGFKNVYVLDISVVALQNFKKRVPDFPEDQLLHMDFFDLNEQFDLIVEQTFFCALEPKLRSTYVLKMNELLPTGGKIVGLLFNIPLNEDHPPFGGNEEEYRRLFSEKFEIDIMHTAYNSIPQRAGNELFIKLIKK
ncbi:methyltransferase domain-containing protein [Aureitalea sp. L0-47]|uniref:TPMT family class I SAM-dependent methyltransferase n=1 Tax=Aureitalea sp. L0-47 TaxID=2816962 RepID=UPI0022375B2E|nr:TPMT family class I SAM-dependent methyltransferase [Aureitalea sp. L0-47]MCW5518834.1 methyltransferase domain-containing protein [Aureitalea sp. L0-47]